MQHATPELFAALAKAQGEIENASKNAANPHFKSKYADLAEVLNTVRPVFSKHGLSLLQAPSFDGSLASVTTLLSHEGGGYITAISSAVPAKSDAQGIGAVTTYLRRYSAAGLSGIAQEDDDGQSARHDRAPAPVISKTTPMDGVWDSFDPEQQAFLRETAAKITAEFKENGAESAAALIYRDLSLTNEEIMGLWTQLDSPVRNQSKKFRDQFTVKQEEAA